jgi:hypothetical protein
MWSIVLNARSACCSTTNLQHPQKYLERGNRRNAALPHLLQSGGACSDEGCSCVRALCWLMCWTTDRIGWKAHRDPCHTCYQVVVRVQMKAGGCACSGCVMLINVLNDRQKWLTKVSDVWFRGLELRKCLAKGNYVLNEKQKRLTKACWFLLQGLRGEQMPGKKIVVKCVKWRTEKAN